MSFSPQNKSAALTHQSWMSKFAGMNSLLHILLDTDLYYVVLAAMAAVPLAILFEHHAARLKAHFERTKA